MLRADFRKDVAHGFCYDINKFKKERLVKSQCASVPHRSTKNATQNVPAAFVRWNDSVSDRERKRADVIGNDAERDIDFFLVRIIYRAAAPSAFLCGRLAMRLPCNRQRAGVFLAAKLFELIKNRPKNIGVVIRSRAGKIGQGPRVLTDRFHALETHSSIDMSLR